jgi:hypothetical protein
MPGSTAGVKGRLHLHFGRPSDFSWLDQLYLFDYKTSSPTTLLLSSGQLKNIHMNGLFDESYRHLAFLIECGLAGYFDAVACG